jgi:tetratricopeptide (TPR) repeat protein
MRRGGHWIESRDREAALAVVEALGRLPLAIDLAAAYAEQKREGVTALARKLGTAERLGILSDPLDASRSVRYVFDTSLAFLPPSQRARFAVLGLLVGADWPRDIVTDMLRAIPADSAASTDGHTSTTAPDTRGTADDLHVLAAMSLITPLPTEQGSTEQAAGADTPQPRIRMHALLHEFARDEAAKPERKQLRDAAMKGLLEGVVAHVKAHKGDPLSLARDEGLLFGTLTNPIAADLWPGLTIEAIDALWSYLLTCCRWYQGVDMVKLQIRLRREREDLRGVGDSLTHLGLLSRHLGQTNNAVRYLKDALRIHRRTRNGIGQGDTLTLLGVLARNANRADDAANYFSEARLAHKEAGNVAGEAWVLTNWGVLSNQTGDSETASRYLQEALDMHGRVRDVQGQAVTLNSLGAMARKAQQWADASRYFDRSLNICRSSGDKAGEGVALNHMGTLARDTNNTTAALEHYRQALTIAREVGDLASEGWVHVNLGQLLRAEGKWGRALAHFRSARALFQKIGARRAGGIVKAHIAGTFRDRSKARGPDRNDGPNPSMEE